ncbi:MAG: DUF58 domain-containing protein [Thermoguttaceae bacterium]|nr:DUF58 domain-containing protein [Thermoguttaceae bacterium]
MKRLFQKVFSRKKNAHDAPNPPVEKEKTSRAVKGTRTTVVEDGLLILAVAALLVFSSAARGINLLMALGAFFVGFVAIDYFWGKRSLRKLRVRRNAPDSAYVGEPFYVEIEIDATERKSSSWAVVVEDEWEDEDPLYNAPKDLKKQAAVKEATTRKKELKKLGFFARLKRRRVEAKRTDGALWEGVATLRPVVYFPTAPKREKRKEYYVGVFTRRGLRRITAITVSTRFPCGFFRSSVRSALTDEIVVFPRAGKLTGEWDAYAGNISQEASASTSLTSRIPDETVAIRDWRAGDSKRTIAWRATAKRDRLQSRDFIRRQTRTILVILDLYASPESAKQRNGELWETTENAISFAATLVKRYTEYGDSQLYFTLNADIPEPASKDGKQKESAARNDAPTDWDSVAGGGSLRRVFTKLALASAPKEDKLREAIRAAKSFNLTDAQVFIVSVEPISDARLGDDRWGAANFVDASSPVFKKYFQLRPAQEEDGPDSSV